MLSWHWWHSMWHSTLTYGWRGRVDVALSYVSMWAMWQSVAHWCGWLHGTMWALHNLKAEGELDMLISGLTVLGWWALLKPLWVHMVLDYAIILRWVQAQDWLETCFITCRSSPVKPKTHDHECSICGLEFAIDKHLGFTWRGIRLAIMGEGLVVNDHVVQVARPFKKKSNSKRVLCLELNLMRLS